MKKGIIIRFNHRNKWGIEPCCCEKHHYTKFAKSTFCCFVCNLFCFRRLFRTESFCKRFGWTHTCHTCRQEGDYHIFEPRDVR